jgi:glycine oxidase
MKQWDVIVVGGGVIGMSLARELHKHGAEVVVLDRTQPGREASHAAAGILSPFGSHLARGLTPLAMSSMVAFPEFVHELEDESGMRVDLRNQGAIVRAEELGEAPVVCELTESDLRRLSPSLEYQPGFYFVEEQSVDPRALMAALLAAAKHRGIHVAAGISVTTVGRNGGQLTVKSERTEYAAPIVVNCCGAWSAEIKSAEITDEAKQSLPVRPVKGQLLSLAAPRRDLLTHMVRTAEVYLVPRSDGRILVGATVEEAGFDKRVQPDVIQRYHQLAANLIPDLGEARMLEAWAGLRPGTPDDLPILGPTAVPGYFVATGHFRNGILLAPITAAIMSSLIRGQEPPADIKPFALERFAQTLPDAIRGTQRRVAS